MSDNYDDAVNAALKPDPAQAARIGFAAAADTNPDAYAEARRVAQRTGVPVDTVFSMPKEIKRQDAVGSIDFDTLAKTSPATAALLADVEKARVAHDDVDNLSGIESALYSIGKFEVNTAKAIGSSVMKFNEGAWGLARAGADLLPVPIGAPLAKKFGEYGREQRGLADGQMPQGGNILEQSWYSGMQSLGLNLLQLPLGIGGKMAPVLTAMGLNTGGQAYGEARDKGVSVPQSLAFGASQGVIEAGTEMLGMPALFGMLKPGQFGTKALEYLIKEQGGEQIATHLQDLNEWATLHPEKTLNDYLTERPAAALQTALATAFGGGGQVAVMKGVQMLANRGMQRAQSAEQMTPLLAQLNEFAAANKVLARDTDTFEQFVAKAIEDGPVQQVFIDAQALMQSGVAEQVAAVSPAVASQLETAASTGGQIAIPIEEYTARIAPTEYAQSLLDHLKTDPEGFSRAEAQHYMQTHGEELRTEVERILADKHIDDTIKQSAETVRGEVKAQLDAVARFTPTVNDAYSAMVSNFYAVMAAKLGSTPEELFKRYPLQVSSERLIGATTFEQSHDDNDLTLQPGKPISQQSYAVRHALRGEIKRLRAEAWQNDNGTSDPDKADERVTGQQLIDRITERLSSADDAHAYLAALGVQLSDSGNYAQAARGTFTPSTLSITLLKNADLSTFLHESGHFFLEVQADIATKLEQKPVEELTAGERQILADMNALLQWFGVKEIGAEQDAAKLNSMLSEAMKTHREAADAYRALNRAKVAAENAGWPDENTAKVNELEAHLLALEGGDKIFELDGLYKDALPSGTKQQSALDVWNTMSFEEKTDAHERFARGFEAYLFEGKAPSIELQGIFQRFRAWLLAVYRELKNLNVELNDQVRGVFDRMLASNEQITLAEQGRSMMPLFTSPAQAGMTTEEFAAYQALGIDATNEAIEELQARGLRDLQWLHNARGRIIKQLQKEAAAKRAEVQMDVRREVMSQPIYRAWQFLTGTETEGGEPTGKLGRKALAEMYGGHADGKFDKYALLDWKRLVEHRMTAEDGVHPDMVAEMFSFTSGDELVRRLAAAETPKAEIEALTDVRMLEQFGELSNPEAIEKAADRAIHNDVRARMVATEANALAKALNKREATGRTDRNGRPITRPILPTAAKEFAQAMISRLKVRDIRPGQYANAEARAARAAEKASKSGDIAQAAAEKRNQLINLYATRAAYDAQDEVDKGVRYLKKFDSESTRKGLDADYTDQIDALLERFDLRKGQSLKAIDKRAALAEWIKAQREAGLEPDIPPELENEAFRKSYREMTVEEFRGLVDTVKQIEHLGRLKHRLLTAADQRAYEAVRDEIAGSIHEHAQGRQADTRTPTTNMGRAVQGLKRFWASHIKAATWARVMDGGKDGGPMWEYFVRSANDRGDMETTMRAEATAKLSEILAPVFKLGKMGGAGQYFPSIGRSLNREARLAIALNMGNEGNRQRLLGGEGWNVAQVAPVLQSLTAAEWHAVQAVWDHFESYRPQIAAKERRVYGKEPEWVAPAPFSISTADGETIALSGGYYPIKYDPAASQRAEEHADAESAKRQLQGAYTTATTRRSFTKARAEEVSGRPLLYTLSGLYSGVNDVIHDLAWHEWLIDANRLLRSTTIDSAIREHYGPEAKQQFKTWVADVAEGDKGSDAAVDLALSRLRQGVSAAGLGFNAVSALMQPLGITQSIVRVGAPWIARGIARYIAHPLDLTREVNSKSSFMENRARTRFRELNELRNQVQDQSASRELVGRYAYFLMMRCQQMVDTPTWWGAYEKAIAAGNDEARAVSLADQAVIDAQGGGQTKDLSAIERGGPAQKLFTVFYSFMNTALNLGVDKTMSADTPAKRAKLAADYALLYVVPAVLGYFLKNALTPGDSGDDDLEKIAKKLLANQIDYLMGLMVVVREFGEAAKTMAGANDMGRDYTGPAGLRLVADTANLAKQTHQGEFDDAFRKASVNVVGDLFGLPSAQLNRTVTGAKAISEGKTSNPAALVFGFQEKR